MTSASCSLIVLNTSLDNRALADSLVSAAFNESIFHEINFKIVPPEKSLKFLLNLYHKQITMIIPFYWLNGYLNCPRTLSA